MTAAIALEKVSFHFGGEVVLSDLSLTVNRGEVVALLGPSGSGKSTLLRLVLGFLGPNAGQILLDGEVMSNAGGALVPPEERNLAVVFQDLALWPHLDVQQNLAFALDAKGVARDERDERIAKLLARVGLQGKEHRYPSELSGGERQRVAVARALVQEPGAILLDEPLSNLDTGLTRELLGVFSELFAERASTVLYVTHELREAVALGARIAILEEGRIVQHGTVAALRSEPGTPFIRDLFAWENEGGSK